MLDLLLFAGGFLGLVVTCRLVSDAADSISKHGVFDGSAFRGGLHEAADVALDLRLFPLQLSPSPLPFQEAFALVTVLAIVISLVEVLVRDFGVVDFLVLAAGFVPCSVYASHVALQFVV